MRAPVLRRPVLLSTIFDLCLYPPFLAYLYLESGMELLLLAWSCCQRSIPRRGSPCDGQRRPGLGMDDVNNRRSMASDSSTLGRGRPHRRLSPSVVRHKSANRTVIPWRLDRTMVPTASQRSGSVDRRPDHHEGPAAANGDSSPASMNVANVMCKVRAAAALDIRPIGTEPAPKLTVAEFAAGRGVSETALQDLLAQAVRDDARTTLDPQAHVDYTIIMQSFGRGLQAHGALPIALLHDQLE